MKKVAILGKPNVGKSSLFNRILRQRDAITSDVSGTTRDVKFRRAVIEDREFELIDTGGIEDRDELFDQVKNKSLLIAKEADIILFMVDGKSIVDDEDKRLFYSLQKLGKDIALVVNKIDNDKEVEQNGVLFYEFGAKEMFLVSVSHNRRVAKLLAWVARKIPKMQTQPALSVDEELGLEEFLELQEAPKEESNDINIAIIGRVNVGKSSLLNALLKEDRAVVSSVAGTTIDPIDETIEYNGRKLTFIDTAGIRKRGKIVGIEKYALNRTDQMLERADLALIVLDASEELKELDEKIAGLVDKYQLASVIILNKWDEALYSYEESVQIVRDKFKFLYYTPIITLSALTNKRVHRVFDAIEEVYANYTRRISTSKLNDVIREATQRHGIPSYYGKLVKIYFATQFSTKPPKIALVSNRPKGLHFSYKRYLVNRLREHFEFKGTPILVLPRAKNAEEKQRENNEQGEIFEDS